MSFPASYTNLRLGTTEGMWRTRHRSKVVSCASGRPICSHIPASGTWLIPAETFVTTPSSIPSVKLAKFPRMIRVLITGASGFVGRHCLRRLLREDCEIHAVTRTSIGGGEGPIHWHAIDLREPSQVKHVISAVRPSHLLHCAWIAIPGVYAHSPENERWLRAGE